MERRPTGALGRRAETLAFDYLRQRGLRPIARNFRSRGGEIDIIMLDSDCLVFIEVRCRMSSAFAHPALTVDRHKQRKIIRTAALFAAAYPRLALHTMRFDVVAVQGRNECNISWVRDAFRPDDSAF